VIWVVRSKEAKPPKWRASPTLAPALPGRVKSFEIGSSQFNLIYLFVNLNAITY